MDILKNKGFVMVLLSFLIFAYSTCSCIYAKEEMKQQSDVANLEQIKILLNEGLEYLKVNAFIQAKDKFDKALKIAPDEMAGEIKGLVAQVSDMESRSVRMEELTKDTKDVVIRGEEEARKLSELQQNIIQFEREQKKRIYLERGKLSFDQGEYEQALLEFNKILVINSQDKDANLNIEKTNSAIEKDKQMQVKRIQEYRVNARTYERDEKYDRAMDELKKIIVANPTDAEALEFMEEIQLAKAEMDEYKRLEDMVNTGKEHLKNRDYDEAIKIWEKVLKEEQDYPGIETLIAQGKFNKSKKEMNVVEDKYRAEREKKMLEVDSAFVPVLGGVAKEKQKQTVEDEDFLAIKAIKETIKQKKVSLEFTDADLRSVILFLSRQSGVNMMIDEAIFAAETAAMEGMAAAGAPGAGMGATGAGIGMETIPTVPVSTYNVTASLRDISLMDALSLILRSRGLNYEIYPNVIWISSSDRIDNVPMETLETKIFDLQFGGPIRGQLRPQPLQLETISFGESSGSSGSSSGE
ncbi:MAG: hypothetical protein KJ887_06325 [Candidatus Omnitrophica bacterium]|nr:hypothetical protein [Candidatus Omnitrophota bacterium]MBU1048180.1 hypothetical protein [Candidatus Omnitrophota bacterium]MBU1630807.1 hypothetical protein [Candidatus Omnitrophota bacterium]MBU1766936.1 hypothetical protein [Candidatus Omnitrophota bacterium]MBU1889658.1 hypothetical protein [Candidatus Omnitrophota bacterium]